VASAEDHWYTVSLLLAQDCWKVAAAEGLIYAVYRLHGGLTTQNDEAGVYLRSRKELLVFARRLVRPERCHEPS
jgi:hypothetical protein